MLNLPSPVPDMETRDFWDQAKHGVLTAQQCQACGSLQFPAYACCQRCNATDLKWSAVSPHGTIYTWTTVHRSPRAEFAGRVPYTLVVVEIDGVKGLRYPGLLVNSPPGQPKIGLGVTVTFEEISDGYRLPVWRLDGDEPESE